MSESAEQKTKRKFIEHLDSADWCYQYSAIYVEPADAKNFALEDGQRLRKRIARKFNRQPFLYRLCLLNRKYHIIDVVENVDKETGEILDDYIVKGKELLETNYELTAFHTFFTTQKIVFKDLQVVVNACVDGRSVRLLNRRISAAKLESYQAKVRNQNPHNLKHFFGDKKINRIALCNKKAID